MNAQTLPLPELPEWSKRDGFAGIDGMLPSEVRAGLVAYARQHEQAVREQIAAGIAGLTVTQNKQVWFTRRDCIEELAALRTAAQQVALGAEGKKL